MTPQEIADAERRLHDLRERERKFLSDYKALMAQAQTALDNRAKTKEMYGELFEKVGIAKKDLAARQAKAKVVPVVQVASQPEPVPVAKASRWQLVKALFGAR